MAFSPSGTKIAAAAMNDDHNIAVYNIQSNALVVSVKGDREKILDIAFISESELVTSGIKHYKVWN